MRIHPAYVGLTLLIASSIPAISRVPDKTMKRVKGRAMSQLADLTKRHLAIKMLEECDHPVAVKLLLAIAGQGDSLERKLISKRKKLDVEHEKLMDWWAKYGPKGSTVDHNVWNKKRELLKTCREKLFEVMGQQGSGASLRWLAIQALAKTKDTEAVDLLYAATTKPRGKIFARAGALLALAECGSKAGATEKIRPLIGDKTMRVNIAAIRACAKLGDGGAVAKILEQLDATKPWQVRAAACRWLPVLYGAAPRAEMAKAVKTLIDGMMSLSGRLLDDYDNSLRRLTGQTYHGDKAKWAVWLASNKDNLEDTLGGSGEESDPPGGLSKFRGIPTRSNRILFVIDSNCWATFTGDSRLQTYFDMLHEKAVVGAMTYQYRATPFKGFVKQRARNALVNWVSRNAKLASRYKNAYALGDALNAMFEYEGGHASHKKGPDTVYWITTGYCNFGRRVGDVDQMGIDTPPYLLKELKVRNELRMLQIHVVAVGKVGDFATASRIAKLGGGRFVQESPDD